MKEKVLQAQKDVQFVKRQNLFKDDEYRKEINALKAQLEIAENSQKLNEESNTSLKIEHETEVQKLKESFDAKYKSLTEQLRKVTEEKIEAMKEAEVNGEKVKKMESRESELIEKAKRNSDYEKDIRLMYEKNAAEEKKVMIAILAEKNKTISNLKEEVQRMKDEKSCFGKGSVRSGGPYVAEKDSGFL